MRTASPGPTSHARSTITPAGNQGRVMIPWFEPEITPAVADPRVHRYRLSPDDAAANVRAVVEAQQMSIAVHATMDVGHHRYDSRHRRRRGQQGDSAGDGRCLRRGGLPIHRVEFRSARRGASRVARRRSRRGHAAAVEHDRGHRANRTLRASSRRTPAATPSIASCCRSTKPARRTPWDGDRIRHRRWSVSPAALDLY